ncbi:MAG: Type fimbrial assembly, ATPase PilB [Actinobacteria bacterium]|jgi:type IV pilus assembly protein PilB|nr:Type fimbrial assembly, ATPase PilB [Actinomycetota bacterium]MEA2503880.1 type pilus assembly protein PilB [Actinomycetota bacterium]MEA2592955.1 type pilus assembly protein PilB [Actinomycetota bacterium]
MFRKSQVVEEDRRQTDDARLPDAGSPESGSETSGTVIDLRETDRWPALPGSPKLGEMLVRKQFVTHAQLSEALLQQSASGKRLGTLLVELGILDERNLAATVADQLGLPLADLRRQAPEPEALALVPEALARSRRALPLRVTAAGIEIAVADPGPKIREELSAAAGRDVILLVAPVSDIERAIDSSYRALTGIESEVEAFQLVASSRHVEAVIQQSVTADAPVVKVVNLIITQGLRDRASDIHIEPQEDRLRIRYRIDGALHDVIALPSSMAPAVISRLKILAEMNIVERQRSQDGQISMTIDGRQVDIRVATTATIWGEKAVLRLLDKSKRLYRLDDLGMSPEVHSAYSRLIRMPFGMVICAGPTGSGKTTTLYATLNEVNDSQRNVMTIEDPVEYILPSINQIQIREQAGISFAGGLKSILRQDPDVILVGEIRDVETARIAVQSALTGHFVMSSLHATDAAAALHRLLDMGIESFLVSSSVVGVVGQRLLRRICRACMVAYQPGPDELAFYGESGGTWKEQFWHGEGCNLCSNTGYQERIGVYELLVVTDEIKNLLVKNGTHEELRAMATSQGMHPLREQATRLVTQDITTIAEVMRNIYTL